MPGDTQHEEGATAAKKPTPLPVGQLVILCTVLITESVASTMLIPFVGYFVVHMQGWDTREAGYAVGFLIGLFMLGQMVASKMFGAASDKYGRKVSITTGVAGCAVMMFLFGVSPNIYVACLWRFCHGLFAGCSLVARTMISDVTDKTNQSRGFSLVSLTWGLGTLFGPTIGALLYDPATGLPWLGLSPDGFFGRNPACLACTVLAAYNAFAVTISVLFLRESNKRARHLYTMFPPSVGDRLRPFLRFIQPHLPRDDLGTTTADGVTIVAVETPRPTSPVPGAAPAATATAAPEEEFGFTQAFANPVQRRVVIICMLVAGTDMAFAEIFPLWEIAPRDAGGPAMSPHLVGVVLFLGAIPHILANVVFPNLISNYFDNNVMRFWTVVQLLYGFFSFLMPFSFYTGGLWFPTMLIIFITRKFNEAWVFSCQSMAVAQVAPPGCVGVMYGIQQFTSCLVRCITPFVISPLFAWSIAVDRPFPINQHLTFILTMLPMIPFAVYLSRTTQIVLPEDTEEGLDDDAAGDTISRHSSIIPRTVAESRAADEDPMLFNNSFNSIANSFAHNPVAGLLQPSVVDTAAVEQMWSEHPTTNASGGGGRRSRRGVQQSSAVSSDSRDASSQNNDDFVETECSSSFDHLNTDALPAEDERVSSVDSEEPVAAENWF